MSEKPTPPAHPTPAERLAKIQADAKGLRLANANETDRALVGLIDLVADLVQATEVPIKK